MLVLPSTSITGAPADGQRTAHVMLVADLAENLFEHVFERHQSGDGAEFVHHHGQVRVLFAKFVDQLIQRLGFGHHQRVAQEAA